MSKPQGAACIFHQTKKAIKEYQVQDVLTKAWVSYGLCASCAWKLQIDQSFKKTISEKLEVLFEKLLKQQEKKNYGK